MQAKGKKITQKHGIGNRVPTISVSVIATFRCQQLFNAYHAFRDATTHAHPFSAVDLFSPSCHHIGVSQGHSTWWTGGTLIVCSEYGTPATIWLAQTDRLLCCSGTPLSGHGSCYISPQQIGYLVRYYSLSATPSATESARAQQTSLGSETVFRTLLFCTLFITCVKKRRVM